MPIPLLLGIPRHKRKKMLYHILLLHQSYVLPSLHENKFDSPPHSTSNQLEYHKVDYAELGIMNLMTR